jgi:tRNA (mo5U34)-methyltransferase
MLSPADPMEATKNAALTFKQQFQEIRSRIKPANGAPWYPYDTFANIWALDQVLQGEDRALFSNLNGKTVADIGAADGALGFFLSSLGADVDLIDNPPSNMNGFTGAQTLKAELNSAANLYSVDLDSQFHLPRRYDFVLFLGILYHLKNPYYALEQLARSTKLAALSTRVTAYSAPSGDRTKLASIPVAYLLDPYESNNDWSNFWIFTDAGLRRLLRRTGWEIVSYELFGGDMETSDPYSADGDRRAFCLMRSLALA